eukprot:CAMPEP_0194200282 /NCGR_PEP_ID=MMETSP0156-20130528/955_1 /TAXON_ID=33649 /ORGANISM="Thalassionema nitzschioides, Strain L26-B" /LENGTH=223 /DNA_ID=CAMNT_0038925257 /DNA_START=39 /DNA_END=710 /DNA_ORIENTATION=+
MSSTTVKDSKDQPDEPVVEVHEAVPCECHSPRSDDDDSDVHYNEFGEQVERTFIMTHRDVCRPENAEVCLSSTFCPCLALREIAQNLGYEEPLPTYFCMSSYPVLLACKAVTGHAVTCTAINLAYLGSEVAERRGIDQSMEYACCQASWNIFSCYMCRVLHESRLYKKDCIDFEEACEVMERGLTDEESEKLLLDEEETRNVQEKLANLIFGSNTKLARGKKC